MLKYMLDTNIIIYTLKNRPEKVRKTFKNHDGKMCVSTVTLGELIYGAERSTQPEKNMGIIEGMMSRLDVLSFDAQDTAHFGQLRAELANIGKPIGPYDTMIAGHARSRGLILVTNNIKRVPGLRIENWV